MKNLFKRVVSTILSLSMVLNIFTTPVLAMGVDTSHKDDVTATMKEPVIVYPIGDESFFKIEDDGSITFADREVDDGYQAVPSAYILGSEYNKDNISYGIYVTTVTRDDGNEYQKVHIVPMTLCFEDNAGVFWFDHGTQQGATVSVEVDGTNTTDPDMSTQFYLYIENGIDPDGITTEETLKGLASIDPRVAYEVTVQTKGTFQVKATVPMYVCMYGYRGTGNVVTPTSEAYQLKNYSTQNATTEGKIVGITKLTSFTKIYDEDHSDEKLFSIAFDAETGSYTWWYSDPADDVNFDADDYTSYVEIEVLNPAVNEVNASGQVYVIYEEVTKEWSFAPAGLLADGVYREFVNAIDENYPLEKELKYRNWNFGTQFAVGDAPISKIDELMQDVVGMPIRITELQAVPSTWRLVDADKHGPDNLLRGELAMTLAPQSAQYDASAVDLADCSAPLDITARGWYLEAPYVTGIKDGEVLPSFVEEGYETTLPIITKALMAGGNVNAEGCTPVVKVYYTVVPVFNAADAVTTGTITDSNDVVYPITYDLNGGEMLDGELNPPYYITGSNPVELYAPVRPGYTFVGWTGSNGNTPEVNVTVPFTGNGPEHYVAVYEKETFKLTYNLRGGALQAGTSNPSTYEVTSPDITLNNPTNGDLEFKGWLEETKVTPEVDVTIPTGSSGDKHFTAIWDIFTQPDEVVIDYGLPVDISVLANDVLADDCRLVAVGPYDASLEEAVHTALPTGFGSEYTGSFGTAKIDASTGKVRYTLNTMAINDCEKIAYAIEFTSGDTPLYYYDFITVVPATTMYFEEDFIKYSSYTWSNSWKEVGKDNASYVWEQEGIAGNVIQAEDRPGKYSLSDANNIYGYDTVNKSMSTYSMGSAMKATVDYDNKAKATFEFYGTGFDVISMTSNTTGTIYVAVYNSDGTRVGTKKIVDTYYGYKQIPGDADGNGTIEDDEVVWVVDPASENAIYQVPVIQVENLEYAKYKAVIEAVWEPIYDNVEGSKDYEFYLDAIRIYNPAGNAGSELSGAYLKDSESYPSYFELRNALIDADTLNNTDDKTSIVGSVFIDGSDNVGNTQISDYVNYGPNNEVYLTPGQSVAFMLDVPANIASVQMGIKSANGDAVSCSVANVSAGKFYNSRTYTINTCTDMNYDITNLKNNVIVVSNTGSSGIVSLTNIKGTYTSAPSKLLSTYMTPAAANLAAKAMDNAKR